MQVIWKKMNFEIRKGIHMLFGSMTRCIQRLIYTGVIAATLSFCTLSRKLLNSMWKKMHERHVSDDGKR